MSSQTIVIAGGGTGGHIYPAVAIARAIQVKSPNVQIHFVGARGGLEEKIVPREKYPLHLLRVGKLHRSAGLLTRLTTLAMMPITFVQAILLLRRLRPSLVLGVGGYASGPFLLIASFFHVPTVLWEPNAIPGMANRWLAPRVDKCLVVFDEARKHMHGKNFVKVGLPVRKEIRDTRIPPNQGTFNILVFGGSQGARAINKCISQAVKEGGDWLEGLQIVHQTGPHDFAEVKQIYADLAPKIQAFEFLNDMDQRYQWAHLVICRAGASTVAEICACCRPAVFIPLPSAADNHQQRNAEVLVRAGAADMVLQQDFSPSSLKNLIMEYKRNPDQLELMAQKLKDFQSPNAAEHTAEELLSQI